MESRHELSVGHEMQAAAETGQIPEVPATSDAGEHTTTWRTSLGVIAALVLAFVMITLVSL